MVELVDARDSKSLGCIIHAGSIPATGTTCRSNLLVSKLGGFLFIRTKDHSYGYQDYGHYVQGWDCSRGFRLSLSRRNIIGGTGSLVSGPPRSNQDRLPQRHGSPKPPESLCSDESLQNCYIFFPTFLNLRNRKTTIHRRCGFLL